MQHVLQSGLASGMSAVSGAHIHKKPNTAPKDFDGLAAVMPEDWIPQGTTRVTYKGKNDDVRAPLLCIGAWPWDDKVTFHCKDEEFDASNEGWKHCLSHGVNFIDTAQVYGSGESEKICGKLFGKMKRHDFVIQTKYFVVPQLSEVLHPTSSPVKKARMEFEKYGP